MEEQAQVEVPQASVTEPSQAPTETPQPAKTEEYVSRAEYNRAREQLRKFENENKSYQTKLKDYEGAKALHERLSQDPRAVQIVQALLEGKIPGQESQDPLEGYDPVIAQELREARKAREQLAELQQWKTQREQQELASAKTAEEREIISARQMLETVHEQRLANDGYLDKDGNPTISEKALDSLNKLTLVNLMANALDQNRPTKEEYDYAYKMAKEQLSEFSNTKLKQTTVKDVPATGSRNGQPTTAKPAMNQAQRIAIMQEAYKNDPRFGFDG